MLTRLFINTKKMTNTKQRKKVEMLLNLPFQITLSQLCNAGIKLIQGIQIFTLPTSINHVLAYCNYSFSYLLIIFCSFICVFTQIKS